MLRPSAFSRRSLLRGAVQAAVTVPALGLLAACGAAATVSGSGSSASASAAPAASSASVATTASAATPAPSSAAASTTVAASSAATTTASSAAAAVTASSGSATSTVKLGVAGTMAWMVEIDPPLTPTSYDQFVAPWNQANPKAKVEPFNIGGGDADKYEKLLTLAAAGTPIDVIGKVTFIQALAKPGALQTIEPFIARDKYDISAYNPNTLKTFGSYAGKQYSLPWGLGGNAIAMIYNPNMISAAGLTPPSSDWSNPFTWDQYRQYAQKLTKKQGTTYQVVGAEELGNWDYTVQMQWGAHWVSPDFTKAIGNSPEMIQALQSYLDMILKDQTSTANPTIKLSGTDNSTRWAAGQTGISWIGGWQMKFFTDPSQYKNDYVMCTFPKGTAASPDQDTIQLAMSSNIKDPDSAWNFIKWAIEGGRYPTLVGRMPVLASDATTWAKSAFAKVPASANLDVLINSLKLAAGPDPVRAIPANATWEKTIATPLWTNLLGQKATVQDGLAQAMTQLQTLLDQSNK